MGGFANILGLLNQIKPQQPTAQGNGGDLYTDSLMNGTSSTASPGSQSISSPSSPQQVQPSGDGQPQTGPRLRGLKGYLSNIFYDIGEASKKQAGLPTDREIQVQNQQMDLQRQKIQADEGYRQALTKQFEMSPVTADEATAWGVPLGMPLTQKQRADLATKALVNTGKTDVQELKNKAPKQTDPIKQALAEAKDASEAGDNETFAKKIGLAHQLATAKSAPPNSEISLILKANNGDGDAQKALDVLQQRRIQLMKERGAAMGQGRLFALRNYYDPSSGQTVSMTGFDYLDAQKRGQALIPTGGLPQDKVIAVQQLQSEATPALKQVRDNLGSFDNATDRAIFARVMKSAGAPSRGDEAGWLGTIMNAALKENLSPQGKQLAIAEGRLAETLGRMRGVLGLQATDSAMALTMRLMPGASTPNSKYAKDQIDTLDSMINKAVEIPALQGAKKSVQPASGNTPPPGARVRDYTNLK